MTSEFNLSERIEKHKEFLLFSNEKIHTDKEGVLIIESLTMNNFLVDWFKDLDKDVVEFIRRYKEALDNNASEKRKIIEIEKAKSLLRLLAGKHLAGEGK